MNQTIKTTVVGALACGLSILVAHSQAFYCGNSSQGGLGGPPPPTCTAPPPSSSPASSGPGIGVPAGAGLTPISTPPSGGGWGGLGAVSVGAGGGNNFRAFTGNAQRTMLDLQVWGGVGEHPLAFRRIYNTRVSGGSFRFGRNGWRHGYEWDMGYDWYGRLQIIYPDGTANIFADGGDGTYHSTAAVTDYLVHDGNLYDLKTPKGWTYRFAELQDENSATFYQMQGFWDSQQNFYAFTYDSSNRVTQVTEPAGRWLQFAYTNDCLSQVTASDGRSVTLQYSMVAGTITAEEYVALTGVTYPDGTAATYTYVQTHPWHPLLLDTMVDPRLIDSKMAQLKYWYLQQETPAWYPWGFISKEINLVTGDNLAQLSAGSEPGLGVVTYPGGSQQSFDFALPSPWPGYVFGFTVQPQKSTDAAGNQTAYTYDQDGTGFMSAKTNAAGNPTAYTYTPLGNYLTITHPDGGVEQWTRNANEQVLDYTDPAGGVTTYQRDTNGTITRIDFPDTTFETFAYNTFGQVTNHTLRNTGVEMFAYDTRGLRTSSTDPVGSVTTYSYDAYDRLVALTDARTNTTSYEYNDRGQITRVIYPDSTSRGLSYDLFGRKTSETNEVGGVSTWTFNELGQMLTATDPLGRTNSYDYSLGGPGGSCCGGTGANLPTRITSPGGSVTFIEYDSMDRRISVTTAFNDTNAAATELFFYDALGNLTNRVDALGKSWQMAYDSRNRVSAAADPLGNVTQWTYDAAGNKTAEIRADGSTTTFTYDALNRLVATTNALGQVTRRAYDTAGHLVQLTDANGSVTTWQYDVFGRQTQKRYADNTGDDFTYDAVGNLLTQQNAAGQVQTFTLDARNRIIASAWSDDTTGTLRAYDASGRLTYLSNAVSVLTHTYDLAGQLTSETQTVSDQAARTVTYTYDLNGRRETLAYPSGSVATNAYTPRGQLASITLNGPPPLATFGYDLAGHRVSRALENGTTSLFTYDDAGHLTALLHHLSGTTLARLDYGYNTVGNRTNRAESLNDLDPAVNDLYSYDSTDQVTGVTYGSGRVVGYQYDPLGNLTQKVDNGTAANYTANSLNQYTYINSQALSYDAKGNLLQRPGWAYTWDAHNRLRSAAPASPHSGSLRLTFSYDGRNRCAIRRTYTWTEGAWQWTTTLYLTYSDWNLLEERDSEGTLAAAYVHGPGVDDVVARLTPTSTLYYHADAQHSTVAVTGAQGDVLERYTYDIFGLPTVRDGASYATLTATAVGNRLLFQGREWLAEVKLSDHRNRLYSPEMQRWLNRDPIGERGGVNLSCFVSNGPINAFDPFGLHTEADCADDREGCYDLCREMPGRTSWERYLKTACWAGCQATYALCVATSDLGLACLAIGGVIIGIILIPEVTIPALIAL